ncbi:rhamnogalacturonate lyase precursor [Marssonina coronariae]|uniref:Rhamnogalacturonate lyase n=1 Tax=Diplocarpon coronariae TaxID=2795749 RepID=A0A218YWL1_9HELO|nr:rhamnogalacturonate lyase precursor [Marssonina coronariae]
MSDLAGTYQYFVNKALPTLGKFRTVFRLFNTRLLSGNTSVGKMSRPRRISLRPVPICRMKRASGPRPHSHHLSHIMKYDWYSSLRNRTYCSVARPRLRLLVHRLDKDEFSGDQLRSKFHISEVIRPVTGSKEEPVLT